MEDFNFITSLTAVPVSVVVIYLVWKFSPTLINLLSRKNGNGNNNALSEIKSNLEELRVNHIHELKESLDRIHGSLEKLDDKLDKVNENLIYIKAKMNGK
jgi:peptidoglycan hydrolase CwlO-like protein